MNAERLLALFERISEAPDAIPRLRRFILDLAVRGKLVEQDPEDEPAEELLKRVSADISDYQQTFNIRTYREKPDSASGPPFRLPSGWQWTRLLGVFRSITDGDHQAPPRADEGVPFLVISDIRSGVIDYNGSRFVPASYYESLDTARRPVIGDLLYTLVGSFGIPVVVRESTPFCVQRHIGILRPPGLIPVEFLALLLDSMLVYKQASDIATGIAQKTVPLGGLRSVRVPLPPLAEQHRIVAKVDELMALCDQLEAARQQREQCRERLVAASLQRLNQPGDEPEAFRSDARFALQVLPSFTSTPAQIKQLRQTILNLAVRGKLVEQDPEDEPAAELLAAIDRDVEDAVNGGRMRNPKCITKYEGIRQYDLPAYWAWTQLGRLVAAEDGAMCDGPFGSKLKTEHYISTPGYSVVRLGNIGTGDFVWGKEGYISRDHFESLRPNHLMAGDLLVAGLADPLVRCCEVPADLGLAVNKADCFRVRLHFLVDRNYIGWYLNSPVAKRFAGDENHGMTRERINLSNAKALPIPLPPLAEQHRIVAKVDELMALCIQLEQQLSQAEQSRRGLLEAVLLEALAEPERMLNPAAGASAA